MAPTKNGTVWKYVSGLLVTFLVTMGAMWSMVTVHADHPHKSSVGRKEFEMMHEQLDHRLDRMEAADHRLESKVDLLLAR